MGDKYSLKTFKGTAVIKLYTGTEIKKQLYFVNVNDFLIFVRLLTKHAMKIIISSFRLSPFDYPVACL